MTDNRHTEEAASVREKSEFLKRIEDFASYMKAEYIDGGGRSLIISAGDRNLDGGARGGMAHIMLGPPEMNVAALASMMQQEDMGDVVKRARLECAEDDETLGGALRRKRRSLRIGYGFAVLSALWTLFFVVSALWGPTSWLTTVSNLLLMAWVNFLIWREVLPLRRQVARLEDIRHREAAARTKREMERLFMESLRHIAENRRDEDDDD